MTHIHQPVISLNSSPAQIAACAHMMAASPPWSELHFSRKQCTEVLSSDTLVIHLAEIENHLVGFIATRAAGMEGEPLLEYICVAPEHRCLGIGTILMKYIEDTLYPNADNLYLFVSDINPRAMVLYERIGYKEVGQFPNYNLWGQTEFLYRKFRRPRQERFLPAGSLTEQQKEGEISGAIDLNSGYARMPLHKNLAKCVVEGTQIAMTENTSFSESSKNINKAVGKLLELPLTLHNQIYSTFSGSIALDRAFAAVRKYALRATPPKIGLTVILPEPSLDLWQLLLKERFSIEQHRDVQIKGVRQQIGKEHERVEEIIKTLKIQALRTPHRQILVILDSPSNPLGIVTSKTDLERLAKACGEYDAVLIVDHCFLLAGIHLPNKLPSVFELSADICNWIGIWDTGKSIDLAGDKAGFIIPGNIKIGKWVDESLAVIQPNTYTARRTIEVFSRLLSSPDLNSYLQTGGDLCRRNLEFLQLNKRLEWTVPTPAAGTFACVYFQNTELTSTELRKNWIKAGVHAAAGKVFLSSNPHEDTPFLRISLFRDHEFFKAAIQKLLK